ncbi:hypothetical protein FEQ05_03812 [Burkholderia pseudomultivorans]|nr:hypothetical protein [Burkholderia pseudomultivorans]
MRARLRGRVGLQCLYGCLRLRLRGKCAFRVGERVREGRQLRGQRGCSRCGRRRCGCAARRRHRDRARIAGQLLQRRVQRIAARTGCGVLGRRRCDRGRRVGLAGLGRLLRGRVGRRRARLQLRLHGRGCRECGGVGVRRGGGGRRGVVGRLVVVRFRRRVLRRRRRPGVGLAVPRDDALLQRLRERCGGGARRGVGAGRCGASARLERGAGGVEQCAELGQGRHGDSRVRKR